MPPTNLAATPLRADRTARFGSMPQNRQRRRRAQLSPIFMQAVIMAAVILSTVLVSFASGVAAQIYYMGVCLVIAIYYLRKSPWLYITMTLWCWTLSAEVRRLAEFHSGFDPKNFILGTPEFICLLMIWSIVNNREILKLRETLIGMLVLIPILFGIAVSFVGGNIFSGIAGSADWIAPVLYYFFVIGHWRTAREADSVLRDFFIMNALVVCLYGIYQFVAAPPWDTQWMIASKLTGMGSPFPFELRVFSVLNVPGVLASWLAVLMMVFLHYKSKITPFILPLLAVAILMTLSRSVAGAVLICLLLAGLMGRRGILRLMVIGGIGLVMGVSALSIAVPEVGDMISKRVTSVEDLEHDGSAVERSGLWARSPQLINDHPIGLGIGAIGRGAVASDNEDLAVIDFGPLAVYLTLGWVAGSVYLLGMVLVLVQAWMVARATRSTAAIAFTCAAVSQVALLPFSNVLGLPGLCIWLCSGYAAALGIEAQAARRVLTRPIDRFETRRSPRELQA